MLEGFIPTFSQQAGLVATKPACNSCTPAVMLLVLQAAEWSSHTCFITESY